MIRLIPYSFLFFIPLFSPGQNQNYKRTLKLMGSRFDITVVASDEEEGNAYIDTAIMEINRIEKMISSWDEHSQTSLINRNAGIKPVKIDRELLDLIKRAIKISEITDGAFDITYAAMDRIWKFDGSMTSLPTEDEIKQSVRNVGYQNIILNEDSLTIFLSKPGMKIGFGAIGKGYAADMARALLMKKGVAGGIINASGDMNVWGKQANGDTWKVGVTNPLNHNKVFSWFDLDNQAVVTSGDYEKYVEFGGKRYAHIIDPRTGWPASGLISVTIFAPKAELADALATSVFVMGREVGIDFVDQIKGVDCIIVDEDGKIYSSQNIQLNYEIK